MRIPESLSPKRLLFQAAAWLTIALVATAFSCRTKTDSQNRNVETLRGEPATLDARGSIVDSNVYLQNRIVEGVAGDGGSIQVTSTGGAVSVNSQARTFNPSAITAGLNATGGLSVASGSMEIRGGVVTNALFVGFGGELILTDGTNLQVNGDVLVQGTIRSRPDSSQIRRDGHDLTITATGAMVVTGTINCSGADATNSAVVNTSDTTDPRNPGTAGGNGGEITITIAGDITITGRVLAEGGSTDSVNADQAQAGKGGAIAITSTGGGIQFAGAMSARAGNSFTNPGAAPTGGSIVLTAPGNITLDETDRIDASGGKNSGALGGAGGTVTIGGTGATTIGGVDLDVSGGKVFFTDGSAGAAGTATFTGASIDLSAMTLNARGGNVVDERQQFTEGPGGTGGTVSLTAGGGVTVAPDVTIQARGGDSLGTTNAGGTGGAFSAVGGAVTFDGSVDIRGGSNFGGQEGTTGTLCATGADATNQVNIVGSNPGSALTVPCP
jgi:fibronectin-binding autotransporter adhesin